ncbi:DNA polymerase IV [candidate division KSB1 bacterium]|nr:DNA polymerase IV [candidate division KSB1 bacterium]
MAKTFLHLDMDAFFAAVEQLDFPKFRGKPVIVGADPKEGRGRGVVSTCSYEARVYGVHSAMPISRAYKLCPHGIYVYPRGRRYKQVSDQIMELLSGFSADIEQISIDEAFLDITSTIKFFGSSVELGKTLKQKIVQETRLTASVGIAPVKFVAKIASDLQKPDGLVVVSEGSVKAFLAPLDLSRLWGVGPKTLPELHKLGLKTIGDLARYPQHKLKMGKVGLHLWNLANGIDHRSVEYETRAKSISKEVTFDSDKKNPEELKNILLYLCNELSREMRRKGYKGRTIHLKIRLQDFSTFTRSRTLEVGTNKTDVIFQNILDLFTNFDPAGSSFRLLGVGLSQLDIKCRQLDLFDGLPENKSKIDDVLDRVREKFGENAITRASLLYAKHDSQWIRD